MLQLQIFNKLDKNTKYLLQDLLEGTKGKVNITANNVFLIKLTSDRLLIDVHYSIQQIFYLQNKGPLAKLPLPFQSPQLLALP